MRIRLNGFFLALITAVLWGVLPVFLQICLQALDSMTITWIRFLFAGLVVFVFLLSTNALPSIWKQVPRAQFILIVAALALVVNYVSNVKSLDYVNPETVQVVMQIAPILLMLGGIVFFKERLNRLEITGAIILFLGLGLFFSPKLDLLFSSINSYNSGIMLVVLAAVTWVAYALMQKVLLRSFTAKQLTLLIYLIGILALTPFIHLSAITDLNQLQYYALLFCCLNTVIAYGCFTEALNIWSAAKVSAVIATGPLFTFLSVVIAQQLLPEQFSLIELDSYVIFGAICVVCGSMTTALAKRKVVKPVV
ncbi:MULTISPECIES: DMT family transporter [Alteromonadaceae]|uniref:DMT family transporter n=1 Tax=Alteromonadaceae TaxID=72275 RepID=UPI001C08C77D|nr:MULTISPECIES: DMT family transporter [Aliiglaciecola]MBU2877365.1 DMT family transporter [Aliiglaciecola lipolytica]MDO6713013.1 DMT family transporter [Aliiglaciecola sp. 2_MG-2023]MDO6754052.1 DMT family transporter [Aliiglaciecola sp. 1_MG-2023]